MLEKLKKEVFEANIELKKNNLIILTWGNVSAIDREKNIVAIKPSGVLSYENLKPDDIVLLDLDGNIVEGKLSSSSDTPTHLVLYKHFMNIKGIYHTHSTYATAFAQAQKEIPCLGTTHADYFYGNVPVTKKLTLRQTADKYEHNTGVVMAERFSSLNPDDIPAVLVANHGPFTWGKSAADAVHNAIVLEEVAKMAYLTLRLSPDQKSISGYLLDRHYLRKHGSGAYYGQKNN